MRSTIIRLFVVLLLATVAVSPTSALAQQTTITVSPNSGPVGTVFRILVAGLAPNERFSIVLQRRGESGFVAIDEFVSDAEGVIGVTYNSAGDPPGIYDVSVTFLARGNQVAATSFTVTAGGGGGSRFFPETGFTVQGRFLEYWEANGALDLNGYPLTNERREVLEDGREYLVQYFERTRLEYHPENSPPNDVLLGQFGRRIRPADPPAEQIVGAFYFFETGHNLSDITRDRRTVTNFGRYWDQNGGLPQFGYPISEMFEERLEDGNVYIVQYFERARFEYHPENADPRYQVLLGQFGRRILAEVEGQR